MKKKIPLLITLILLITSQITCNQDDPSPVQEVNTPSSTTNLKSDDVSFASSSFSDLVELSVDKQWIRLDFDFFPPETSFDVKTVSITCFFDDEEAVANVSEQLSAGEEKTERFCYTLTLDESMYYDEKGLVMPYSSPLNFFSAVFGIVITDDAVQDKSGKTLTSTEGTLDDYFRLSMKSE